MRVVDERIIEFLDDQEYPQPPSIIAEAVEFERPYVNKRCQLLVEAGFLKWVPHGQYTVTTLGHKFRNEQIDARAIPDPAQEAES